MHIAVDCWNAASGMEIVVRGCYATEFDDELRSVLANESIDVEKDAN